jgi:transposase
MGSMGRKKPRPRRSFTPGVPGRDRGVVPAGGSVGRPGRAGLDLTETAVRAWVKQAEHDAGARVDGALTSAEREELQE